MFSLVNRIIVESKRLTKEEETAEELLSARREALRKAQADLEESLNRSERLRRQKRSLLRKGNAMARLCMQELEELEEQERSASVAAPSVDASH